MQVNKKGLTRIVAIELHNQFTDLGIEVIGRWGSEMDSATQFEFPSVEDLHQAEIHVATMFSVKEYGYKTFPSVEDFSKHDPAPISMLEIWFHEQVEDPIEVMLRNEQNGQENVILGAFVSADGTYPIFVTRVVEISKNIATGEGSKYRLSLLGVKWGYDPALNWPGHLDRGEAYLERNTDRWLNQMGEQFKSLDQLNRHQWKPSYRSLAVPQAWHDKYTFVCFDDMPVKVVETDDQRIKRAIRSKVRPCNI